LPGSHCRFAARIQVKEFALGAALVLCFSIGLAITLDISGRCGSFQPVRQPYAGMAWPALARRAPYLSVLIALDRHLHILSRLDRRQ
jgi:nickel/cobalt exporter